MELAEGTRPLVHTAGGAWAAEWVSHPVRAVVTRGGQVLAEIPFDRPVHY